MKRNLIMIVIAAGLLSVAMTMTAATPKQRVQRVATGEGLLRALASNTRIIISEGAELHLTDAISDDGLCKLLKIKEIDTYDSNFSRFANKPTIGWHDNFDGRELVVAGMNNLTIEGEGNGAHIIVTPRYAFVLNFIGCKNVKLLNLTLGHTEEGYCQGGVVGLSGCENVVIDQCDMFGCGTEGICAEYTKKLVCTSSFIRDCSYDIMTLSHCTDAKFEGCEFFRNKEFTLVTCKSSTGVVFSRCYFNSNQGVLFGITGQNVVLDDCVIDHPEYKIGSSEKLTEKTCDWLDTSDEPKE